MKGGRIALPSEYLLVKTQETIAKKTPTAILQEVNKIVATLMVQTLRSKMVDVYAAAAPSVKIAHRSNAKTALSVKESRTVPSVRIAHNANASKIAHSVDANAEIKFKL